MTVSKKPVSATTPSVPRSVRLAISCPFDARLVNENNPTAHTTTPAINSFGTAGRFATGADVSPVDVFKQRGHRASPSPNVNAHAVQYMP
jgi:hypothetical protein